MTATATAARSIDVVRRFNREVFNGRDYDLLAELQSPEYIQHGPLPGAELSGREESEETMRTFHAAFPDVEATEEVAFSDGEYVCTHYTYRGTHDGDLMGIPATGKRGEVWGTVINRIEDGRIAEAWVLVDLLGLLQQVGVVPALDELAA